VRSGHVIRCIFAAIMKFQTTQVFARELAKVLAGLFLATSLFVACGSEENSGQTGEVNTNQSVEEQIAQATKEIEADRMNASAFHTRAQLHLYNRNIQAAMDDITIAIKIDDHVAYFHYSLSDIHFANGDVVLATEALSTGLDLDPENVHALLVLAELYYALRDMKSSITIIKRIIAVDEHNARAYLIHGMIFSELGDTTRALASLQTAVENDPNLEEAYLEMGMIHYETLNPLTVPYLDNVISLNPKNQLALYTKSMFYQKTGEVDLATDIYLQILEVNPNNSEAHYNLGHIAIEFKDDYDGAAEHFTNAIDSDSAHYKAYYMRGLCLESMGLNEGARADYVRSLDLMTNYDLAIQGLNRLDKLAQ